MATARIQFQTEQKYKRAGEYVGYHLLERGFREKEFVKNDTEVHIPGETLNQELLRESHLGEFLTIINENLKDGMTFSDIEDIRQGHKMGWMAVSSLLDNESAKNAADAFLRLEDRFDKYSILKYPEVVIPPNPRNSERTVRMEAAGLISEFSVINAEDQKLLSRYIGAYMAQILDYGDREGLPYGEREPIWPTGFIEDKEEDYLALVKKILDVELISYYESLNVLIDEDKLLPKLQERLKILDNKEDGSARAKSVVLFQGPPAVGKGTILGKLGMRNIGSGSDGYLGGGGVRVAERNIQAHIESEKEVAYDFATYISHPFDIPRSNGRYFPSKLMNIAITTLLVHERKLLDEKGLEDTPIVLEGFPRDANQFRLFENLDLDRLVAIELQVDESIGAIRQIMRIFENESDGEELRGDDFLGLDFSKALNFLNYIGINFKENTILEQSNGDIVNIIRAMMNKRDSHCLQDLVPVLGLNQRHIMNMVNLGRSSLGEKNFSSEDFNKEIVIGRNYQLIQAYLLGLLVFNDETISMEENSRFNRFANAAIKILTTCDQKGIRIEQVESNWKSPGAIADELREKI